MLVSDIHHVSLNVADTERALAFYRDLLGLGELPRPDFGFPGAWLDAGGGQQVHLIESSSVPPDVGQHMAFRVDDVDAVVGKVRAAGYTSTDPVPVGDTGMRQAFANDLDGNRVEFTQPAT